MALVYTCDCGKAKPMQPEDLVPMGVSQKMYCKGDCEKMVQEFLDARDELHDKTQEFWNEGLKKLYAEFKDFEPPDRHLWTKK